MYSSLTRKARATFLVTCLAILLVTFGYVAATEAAVVDSTAVTLTWQKSTDPDCVAYNVMRSNHPNGPFKKVNDTPLTDLVFTDSTVQDLGTYYYVVTARDAAGNESSPKAEAVSEPVIVDLAADPTGDVDNDGIPNEWETRYGLDRRVRAWHRSNAHRYRR